MDTIRHYTMLIGGDWVDADERFEIRSPATGEMVASVAKGGREHADRAVAEAKAAHADGRWRRTPPAERAAVLGAIADRLSERIDDLAVLEAQENGTPVRQAGAFQIGFSIAHLRYFADLARTYAFERPGPLLRVPTLASGIVRREPVGVCAAIVPWNFPLLLAMWKIGPALAAGNTLVVKPDEHTPLTLLEFARIAQECGLPPGVLNVVPGEGSVVGARLASHPDVRKIAFTGSTAVGREINDMTIAREEIFGPVLAVIRAESTDQAIRIANDTEYGLSAGVWSTDNQRALEVAGQLEAGTVWINDWHMVNAAYPFGAMDRPVLGDDGCRLRVRPARRDGAGTHARRPVRRRGHHAAAGHAGQGLPCRGPGGRTASIHVIEETNGHGSVRQHRSPRRGDPGRPVG